MAVEFEIISIGTLSQNRLWGESAAVRTAHATTTLVRDGGRTILVDPSLPAQILAARLFERTGRGLDSITDVFCTTLRPIHRRGIEAFESARWWASEIELAGYRQHLERLREAAGRLDTDAPAAIDAELALLKRFAPAPEKFSEQVQVYPLAGATAGAAGLLLLPATQAIVIAGDAAITAEHVRRGQVWAGCVDAQAALQTLGDLIELADAIVPGHDNVMFFQRHWL